MYIGIDIVEIKKIKHLIKRESYINQVYTRNELRLVENYSDTRKVESLAGKFAVKEATVKALGTGFDQGIVLTDIETLKEESGKAILLLHNRALQIAEGLKITELSVSISHCESYAVGLVVLT